MQEAERCADLRKELSAERRAKTELGRGLAELRSKERAWRKERQVSLTIACHALPRVVGTQCTAVVVRSGAA